ncbi:response regulator transcription factor [Lewinella cohaerens]|uniref:response regulator transcription factor n=1 Tax=Lewinella cohaerens TaxID=70995 RepID=UPI00035F610F|nr:response regulator transcription factor [Lewinella cohaerens]
MRIAIADDEELFRKGISMLLTDFEGVELAFQAGNGQELLDQLAAVETQPDILLLDLNMPILDGVEAAKILQEKYPELKFIVLSSYYSKAFIVKMIELGAAAYLVKNSTPEDMEHTIREVAEKGFYYDDKVMSVIRDNIITKTRPPSRVSFRNEISNREQEVLQLICEELTTPEIAARLFISPRTVHGHRNSLLSKLDCKNTAGLVVVALQEGLVDIKRMRF